MTESLKSWVEGGAQNLVQDIRVVGPDSNSNPSGEKVDIYVSGQSPTLKEEIPPK